MFRFFRQIRQKLFLRRQDSGGRVQEGKVSRYLGYALGEIVLIVAGILIAVQIGEWNRERADRTLARQYIQRLIENIEIDIPIVADRIEVSEMRLGFTKLLMDAAGNVDVARNQYDDFILAFMHAGYVINVTLRSDTFEELRSTGHLRLLSTKLKSQLMGYYGAHENARQFDRTHDLVSARFFEIGSGILTLDQKRLILDIGFIRSKNRKKVKLDEIEPAWVDDIHFRFIENEEFVNGLPLVQRMHERITFAYNVRHRMANELLEALNQANAELSN